MGIYDAGGAVNPSGLGKALGSISQESTTKPDGLQSCLHRMQGLASELWGNAQRLEQIADSLNGARPASDGKAAVPQVPDNALFLARQLENSLGELLTKQRAEISRIEQAIS